MIASIWFAKLKRPTLYPVYFLALLLLVQAGLLVRVSRLQSITIDEGAHLLAGLVQLDSGDTSYFEVNPPLVRLLSAAVVAVLHDQLTIPDVQAADAVQAQRIEFREMGQFLDANAVQHVAILQAARRVPCLICLCGTIACFLVARSLFGDLAAAAAACCWAFLPIVLGYGSVLSMDVPGAVAMIVAIWIWWRELHVQKQPSISWLTVVFSLLVLVKFSLLVLLALLPFIYLCIGLLDRSLNRDRLIDIGSRMGTAALLTMLVVHLAYGFDRTFQKLEDYEFYTHFAGGARGASGNAWRDTWAGKIPIPIPAGLIIGIDEQKIDFEYGLGKNYLLGRWSDDGWYHYYAVGLLAKLPEGLLLLLLTSPFALLVTDRKKPQNILLCYLIICGLAVFMLVSSQTKLNQHFRYCFPVVAVAAIMGSAVFAKRNVYRLSFGAACLLSIIASGVLNQAHAISYFNLLSGGPENGRKILLHSGLDWGQELYKVRAWLDANPQAIPVQLIVSHASFDLSAIDIPPQVATRSSPRMFPMNLTDVKELPLGVHIVAWQYLLDPDSPYYPLRHQVSETIGDCYAVLRSE